MEGFPQPRSLPGFARFELVTEAETSLDVRDVELAGISATVVPARRRQFEWGRTAAHRAIAAAGLPNEPILMNDDRSPRWPAGVVGSITHSDGAAAALVAPQSKTDGVGLDLELMRQVSELEAQVSTHSERRWLDRLDDLERSQALLELFSAKESIYKALSPSVKRYFGFEAAVVEPAPGGYSARMIQAVDDRYPPSRKFTVGVARHALWILTWVVLPKT